MKKGQLRLLSYGPNQHNGMDMNLWTTEDFLLAGEWGLDLPDTQPNGHFGDLKVNHDLSIYASAQDVGGMASVESPSEEGDLGLEWMESSDLGSYLDVLDGNHEKLPIESALYELNAPPPTEANFYQIPEKEDLMPIDLLGRYNGMPVQSDAEIGFLTPVSKANASSETAVWVSSPGDAVSSTIVSFDALVSPPESPVQVAPVIKLEEAPIQVESSEQPILAPLWDIAYNDDIFMNQDSILGEVDFSTVTNISDSSCVDLEDARQLISSPLSVDDVEDTLASSSFSSPSSPDSSRTGSIASSIIDTCPELYKVISTSSIKLSGSSKRFAPYQKSGASLGERSSLTKSVSKSGRKRAPAEPVPEYIIVQQVNKKDRKKLQNKNAAIRYRMKKKEEAKGIKSEEQELEEINTGLKNKVEDLEREVRYMKNLMEEVYKAKGIIKNEK